MKVNYRILLWISSMVAAVLFIALSQWFTEAGRDFYSAYFGSGEQEQIRFGWGFFALGFLLLLGSTLLFLLGKKLKSSFYVILYLVVMLISIIAATVLATF